MKNWKMKYLILGSLVIGFLFFNTSVSGQMKPIELTYSHQWPAVHKLSMLFADWGKEIEKRTDGRVKIIMFPANTLTPADKNYISVVSGISDIGSSTLGYTRGKFPLTEVIDLPLGHKSGYAATRLINEYYNKFKPKEFDEVKVLYFFAHGPGIFHTKKPVYKLEDLKGMKIRCSGLITKIVAALGGVPVSMPMPETYDALSKGIVEGSVAPFEALKGFKLGEVVKFTTESFGSAYSSGFFAVMNKGKWNSLPPDTQKIIETVNIEWIEKNGKLWDEIDKEGRDFILTLGNKIITLSKEEDERWTKAVRPLLDEYVNNMKAKGLPGDEVLKFCLDQLKQLQ